MTGEPSIEEPIVWTPRTGVAVTLLALLGLAAAFALTVDRIKLLRDPDHVPSCNFNPVLSCGSVMTTDQAQVFGFPNPILGLTGFSVLMILGVLLTRGIRLPGSVMLVAAVSSALGLVFMHWLLFQSLYRIGALCPWCMVVWAVTTPLALWFTLKAADQVGTYAVRRAARALWQWRFTLLALWYLAIALLVLVRFWDYWSTLL